MKMDRREETIESRQDLRLRDGEDLIFKASLAVRDEDGFERNLISTQGMRPRSELRRAMKETGPTRSGKWWLCLTICMAAMRMPETRAEPVRAKWKASLNMLDGMDDTLKEIREKAVWINEVKGAAYFEEAGYVIPEAGNAAMAIKLEVDKTINALEEYARLAKNKSTRTQWISREAMAITHRLKAVQKLYAAPEREERDIAGIIATILGIKNQWDLNTMKSRLSGQEKATRLVVKEIHANKDFAEGLQKEVDEMNHEYKKFLVKFGTRVATRWAETELLEAWIPAYQNASALANVLESAFHHRLHADINGLVDMEEAWGTMQETARRKGDELPEHGWQAILATDIDYFALTTNELIIVAHLPTRRQQQKPMKKYRWRGGPLVHGNRILELQPQHTTLAVDEKEAVVVLQEQGRCRNFGIMTYCEGTTIKEMYPASQRCVTALFRMQYERAQQLCTGQVRPIQEEIWPITTDAYLISSEKGRTFTVECKDGTETAQYIEKGLWEVTVAEGCKILAPEWATGQGGYKNETLISIEIGGVDMFVENPKTTNVTEELEMNLSRIRRPTPAAMYEEQIENELNRRGWRTQDIVTTSLAAIAMLITGAISAYLAMTAGTKGRWKRRAAALPCCRPCCTQEWPSDAYGGGVEAGERVLANGTPEQPAHAEGCECRTRNDQESESEKVEETRHFNAKRQKMIQEMLELTEETIEILSGIKEDGAKRALKGMKRVAQQLEGCAGFVVPTPRSITMPEYVTGRVRAEQQRLTGSETNVEEMAPNPVRVEAVVHENGSPPAE